MSERTKLLFSEYELSAVIDGHGRKLVEAIDTIDGNRLLNTSVEDLCNHFEGEYQINVPQIKLPEITVEQDEAEVDVSQDPRRFIRDRSQPFYIRGTSISYHVPFEGDSFLFMCRPSHATLSSPRARVEEHELVFSFSVLDHNSEVIKSEFGRSMGDIQMWLARVADDVRPFNEGIRERVLNQVETRREKLLKDQGLVASLGYPLKERPNAPRTFTTPQVRRRAVPRLPSASTAAFVPEPTLDKKEYEHILAVISNMVAVMERSPNAFRAMNEENLRQHFLVQLNGQYEGQATGETFNFEGKTDILVRTNGRNIFIAECMYWDGPKTLKHKLDQLLGYACWRDTKTAILVFNRTKNFSAVVERIPEVVRAHPNFKRELDRLSETASRYLLHHRDDKNKELIVTVLAFEIPT
ncbi:hypothetical protein B7486_23880 [cyanobacterium TDX16]|nr:hypothetical protein B7486_23880 [cyanobacterium TDX16]